MYGVYPVYDSRILMMAIRFSLFASLLFDLLKMDKNFWSNFCLKSANQYWNIDGASWIDFYRSLEIKVTLAHKQTNT